MRTQDKQSRLTIGAALLALFLGALDALVMTAAMPSVVAELGGMSLYAWVYSAYFLSRTVSLPVFGKLSDLYSTKTLMMVSISIFVLASAAAGASCSMAVLVGARVFQGIGAGGIFALVYVVLADVSSPEQRGKTLSLASAVWGISSVIGPTLGAVMVTYLSWPWIFYMNIPLGLLSLAGIGFFFREVRVKSPDADLDLPGILLFTMGALGGLTLVMTGGREIPWDSPGGAALAGLTLVSLFGFVWVEKKREQPFLDFGFFKIPGFALANAVTLGASFVIFSLFAYAPLFLQGAMSQSPMMVGYAMLSLSLGWSVGGLFMGRRVNQFGLKKGAVAGAVLMAVGAGCCLTFDHDTSLVWCFSVFMIVGLGMGCITLTNLLITQESLPPEHLGTATSLHQFSRTLGGAVGVGICGSLVFSRFFNTLEKAGLNLVSPASGEGLQGRVAGLFLPEVQSTLSPETLAVLQRAVLDGVGTAFFLVCIVAVAGCVLSLFLPSPED